MANTLEIVINAKDNASGVLDKIAGKVSSFGSGISAALRPAAMAGGMIAGAIAGIGVVAARTFGPMIDAAREFEGAVVDMGIAAADTGLSLDELEAAAIAVGMDTGLLGVTAAGAADSITAMFKAGLTATEVFGDLDGYMAGTAELSGALRAAIDLAAASELDMVQASDLAVVALSTFGGELETEAERAAFVNSAMDYMVRTANASVSSVTDLADALSTAGPVFAMFGFDVEDTNTALALLSTRGIKGAEAGTSLKSMLVNMTSPVKSVQEAWDALGLSMYDSEGNMRELPDIIADLNTAMAGYTEEQKQATLVALAGSYGIKALSTLLSEGESGWYAMKDATSAAMGMAEQAALKINSLAGAQEVLAGIMETLKIQIGSAFLPAIKAITVAFAGLAEKYGPAIVAMFGQLGEWLATNLPGIIAGAIAWFESLIASLTPIVAWIIAFVQEHGPLLKEAFIGIAAVLAAFVAAGTLAAIVLLLVNLANPISLIAAGLALLAVAWTRDWGGIRTTLTAFWEEKGKPIFEAIKEWLGVNIPAAIATVTAFWQDTLLPALQVVWAFIQDNVIPIFVTVFDWLSVQIPAASAATSGFWTDTLLPALQVIWGFIDTKILPIFTTVKDWLGVQIPAATAVTSSWWTDTLWPALEKVWAFIDENILPIIKLLYDIEIIALDLAVEALAGLWSEVLWPALEKVWKFIQDNVVPILKTLVQDGLEKVKEAAETLSEFWTDTLYPALEKIWLFIRDNLGPIFQWFNDSVMAPLKGTLDAVKDALGWVSDKLTLVKDALAGLSLPDWLVPGSPTPLELGIRGISDALKGMPTAVTMLPGSVTAGAAGGAGSTMTTNHNYYLNANYGYQSERSLAQDVRMLAMLAGG